jgi:hypothetical protein
LEAWFERIPKLSVLNLEKSRMCDRWKVFTGRKITITGVRMTGILVWQVLGELDSMMNEQLNIWVIG